MKTSKKHTDKRRAALFGNKPSPVPMKEKSPEKRKVKGFVFKTQPKTPSADIMLSYDDMVQAKNTKSKPTLKRDTTSEAVKSNETETTKPKRQKTGNNLSKVPQYPKSKHVWVPRTNTLSYAEKIEKICQNVLKQELKAIERTYRDEHSWIFEAITEVAEEFEQTAIQAALSDIHVDEFPTEHNYHNPKNITLFNQERTIDTQLKKWKSEEEAWEQIRLDTLENNANQSSVSTSNVSKINPIDQSSTTPEQNISSDENINSSNSNMNLSSMMKVNATRLSMKLDFLIQYLSRANTVTITASDRAVTAVNSYVQSASNTKDLLSKVEPKAVIQSVLQSTSNPGA